MAKYVDVGEYRYMTQDGSGHQITPIGRGSYGTVWLGEHKKSNTRVAIKKSENRELYMNKFIDNELQIHKNVQHPNLVRCYHVEVRKVIFQFSRILKLLVWPCACCGSFYIRSTRYIMRYSVMLSNIVLLMMLWEAERDEFL